MTRFPLIPTSNTIRSVLIHNNWGRTRRQALSILRGSPQLKWNGAFAVLWLGRGLFSGLRAGRGRLLDKFAARIARRFDGVDLATKRGPIPSAADLSILASRARPTNPRSTRDMSWPFLNRATATDARSAGAREFISLPDRDLWPQNGPRSCAGTGIALEFERVFRSLPC